MKKIIVTGCSSGIGFYLAENLAISNFDVIGLARNEPTKKNRFKFEKCDVRDFNSVSRFFSQIKKQ